MVRFNSDTINDLVCVYLYENIEGRNPEVLGYVEFLWEQLSQEMPYYQHGEVDRVLNSFQMCVESEDEEYNKKAVKGIKTEDVAYIATHYGLLYGLVWAENLRLNFWKG